MPFAAQSLQRPRFSLEKVNRPMNDDAPSPILLSRLLVAVGDERDKDAFEQLYRHFIPRLRSYMKRLTKDTALAEELSQETLVAVWRKAGQFDPAKGQASTWIFRIARNLHIDKYRRGSHPEFDENDPAFVPDEGPSADILMIREQEARTLGKALMSLRPDQVEILKMSYFEEIPHSAIAQTLGIPLGTVKSRIRMACGKLRQALGDLR